MQLYGVKEYLVFPPDQSRYFYPRTDKANVTSIPDIENVDLSRFPLFAQAEGSRFELHPGETLFVPAGWWHTARILTTAITVSINGVSAVNWPDFRRDYCAAISEPFQAQGHTNGALLVGPRRFTFVLWESPYE